MSVTLLRGFGKPIFISLIVGIIMLLMYLILVIGGNTKEKEYLNAIDAVVQEVSAQYSFSNVVTRDYHIWNLWDAEDKYIKCDVYLETQEFNEKSLDELAKYSDELENKLTEIELLGPEQKPLNFIYGQLFMCPVYDDKNGCMAYERCSSFEIAYRPLFENVGEKKVYHLEGSVNEETWQDSEKNDSSSIGKKCEYCNGTGKKVVEWYSEGDWGEKSYSSYECTRCDGTGRN